MTAAQASAKLASRLLLTDRWKEMPEPLTRKWHWSNDLTKGRVQLHVSAAGKLQHTHLISLCALLLQSDCSAFCLFLAAWCSTDAFSRFSLHPQR